MSIIYRTHIYFSFQISKKFNFPVINLNSILLLFPFILLVHIHGNAQESLIYEGKQYDFKLLLEKQEGRPGLSSYKARGIMVHLKGKKHAFQSIKVDVEPIPEYLNDIAFLIEDVNFDEHEDIRLLNNINAYGYAYYDCWIYEKASGKYARDTLLTKFVNVSFNPEYQTVHTYWRVGLSEFGHALYKWESDSLSLVVEETANADYSERYADGIWFRIIRWRKEGEFLEVEFKADGHDGFHYDEGRLLKYLE